MSSQPFHQKSVLSILAATLLLIFSTNIWAFDTEAAKTLARQNDCFKCHAVEKKKEGPPYKEVAAKYRGKANAEERLLTHITSGEKAKFPDGHEEEHKIIKTKDAAQIKNLIEWILSL